MRKRKLFGLIVQLPEGGEGFNNVLEDAAFAAATLSVVPEATLRIDLRESDENILGAMSPMRRRNILKSLKESFEFTLSDDVPTFHRLHLSTSYRQGFEGLTFEYLNAQWRALSPLKHVTILLASYKGHVISGLWLSNFAGVVTFRLAGWDRAIKAPAHVNEALHWKAIQWARSVNASFYDLGGFDRNCAEQILMQTPINPNMKSHNFFKLGFGATPVLLPRAHILVANQSLNWLARRLGPSLLNNTHVKRLAHRLRT
jgi:lipid II:glycine glycyltransferase (peptidoglycan interpeptide bridge formation enzyme)